MKKIIPSFVIIFAIVGFFSSPKLGEAFTKTKTDVTVQNDFIVEPGKTEIYLNPGENTVKNISVTNRVNKTVNFKLTTEDFVGTDDPNQPVVLMGDTLKTVSNGITTKQFVSPENRTSILATHFGLVAPE